MLNSSSRLDWTLAVAPVLTEYMMRMMIAGYNESYRQSTIGHAIRIHDKMIR